MTAKKTWALAYTTAHGDLRIMDKHTSRLATLTALRLHLGLRPAFVNLMQPWWALPPGTYEPASVGGTYAGEKAELLYGRVEGHEGVMGNGTRLRKRSLQSQGRRGKTELAGRESSTPTKEKPHEPR